MNSWLIFYSYSIIYLILTEISPETPGEAFAQSNYEIKSLIIKYQSLLQIMFLQFILKLVLFLFVFSEIGLKA